MHVGMVGTGYVGLVSGVCFSQLGHTVFCVDIDADKIRMLKNGVAPIYEADLPVMLLENIEAGRIKFSTSLAEVLPEVEVVFLAIGTPECEDGSVDLSYLFAAAEEIGKNLETDLMVVIKSTVPVGTGELVEEKIRAALRARGLSTVVTVSSNPEFLQEGSAVDNFMHPQRIVVGVETEAEEAMYRRLYGGLLQRTNVQLVVMNRRSSELTKYAANGILASRVGFINEIARLASKVSADIDMVRLGMGLDSRIGVQFLKPGPGYGGSCFPKDVSALIKAGDEYGAELAILKAVQSSNEHQKEYAAKKIVDYFNKNLTHSNIAIFGLSFKPGTDDVRESPALTIIERLLKKGATVYAHDPISIANFKRAFGQHERLHYLEMPDQDLRNMDAIAIITDWDCYHAIDWNDHKNEEKTQCIFDFRNQLDSKHITSCGYQYHRL